MSSFTRSFGPACRSRLDLMGIRFADTGGDGSGAGGEEKGDGFTPPANQAELDKILETRLARERDKFKDYDSLKASAAELAQIKNEKKTPDEKAVEAAREEGRAEVRSVLANERVKTAFDKALEGRALNAAALLDFDRSKFIKEDGADSDAIKTWVEANSTEVKTEKVKDPGQGNRDSTAGGSVQAGRDLFDAKRKKTS